MSQKKIIKVNMKTSDQLMLESLYNVMYKNPNLAYCKEFNETEIGRLLEQDLQTIEELIEEGIFGDIIDKAKQGANALAAKAKTAVSGLKQGVVNTVAKKVLGLVMSKLNDQEKAKMFSMLLDGKVDKNSLQELKKSVSGQQVQESILNRELFEDDKTFFVQTFFTKEVLCEAIANVDFITAYNELLTEAETVTPNAPQNRPLRKAMQYTNQMADEFAADIAAKLQELYGKNSKYGKNNRHIQNALPKIRDGVNKRLDNLFKANFGVTGSKTSDSAETPNASGEAAPNASGEAAPKKTGFIQRILKFISNPKVYVTAGLAVAIIGFIAAAAGGAAISTLLATYAFSMAKGAGAKILWGAVSRKMQGKKILDIKALASDAGKGALMGAVGAGIGSIIASVTPFVKGLFGAGEVMNQQPVPQTSVQQEVPDKGFESTNGSVQDTNPMGIDAAKDQFEAVLRSQGIKGVEEWAGTASPAFTNAAGDLQLDKNQYAKLAHEISKMSSEDAQLVQDVKNIARAGGGQGKAQELASNLIKNWLKR